MAKLAIGYDTVVWVTSAYLLGYAVLLLVAGRLGDRFGPKNLYLIGLVVFTVASVWCGLSGSAGMLIAARVAQGVGAGVLTPQTLSTITRIFPAHRRGAAMSVWGATAGVASLVGPLAGGGVVDSLGWQWIFFVNVPVGIVALVLAVWLVPVLPTQLHQFDWIGVGLSGVGMFLIVFGLQEGESAHWQPWIWAVIVAGVGFLSTFIYWQALNTREPLIPLDILGYRNYSLCNVGVAVTAFAMTGMVLPLTFYAQAVCGLSPTRSALLIAPMAITSGVLAPLVGVIVDRSHPLPVLGFGFSAMAIGLTWLAFEMAPGTPIWRLMLPFSVIGVSMAFVWSPLTATATRDLPPGLAGAGSGVYNATRQLGAVLGSAGMAAFMTARIAAETPSMPGGARTPSVQGAATLQLPEYVREPFSAAMSQSMLLPAFIALFGIVAVLFLEGFTGPVTTDEPVPDDGYDDGYDDYVEYVIRRDPDIDSAVQPAYDEGDTEPLVAPVGQPRPASAEAPHSDAVASSHGVPADPVSAPLEPIGFAHNGSPADDGQRFRAIAEYSPWRNKHRRADPDDYGTSGRHSFRGD
jgi:EmrB/QacA subfamily drug resistance transporter